MAIMTKIKEVDTGAKESAVKEAAENEYRALFRMVYHDNRHSMTTDLYRLEAELVIAGYRIETAWGKYLHTPDGRVIVLDDWNEVDN